MLEWMAWTPLTATFFCVIAALLVGMTLWERVSPTVPRAGFLRITTTRGERLFIALLTTGWINILWIAVTEYSQWGALGLGVAVSALILWRG
jgi:predicted small integral membrane protein